MAKHAWQPFWKKDVVRFWL